MGAAADRGARAAVGRARRSAACGCEPSADAQRFAPRDRRRASPRSGYESGLGPLSVDLRHTALPATGTIPLKIDAGVRRTLVALPHDRCVHVAVDQRDARSRAGASASLVGRATASAVNVFGQRAAPAPASPRRAQRAAGPTLHDRLRLRRRRARRARLPRRIDPGHQPDWPGYPVYVEERPDTTGLVAERGARLLRDWRARREEQERSQRPSTG